MEVISFSLIVQHNNYQRTIFSSQTASVFCNISSSISDIKNYFALGHINQHLVDENIRLKNDLEKYREYLEQMRKSGVETDTMALTPTYAYQTAQMINSSFNKTKNYITLDKGILSGIKKEMAVCSAEGVVGVIQNTSNNYSVVLPLINVNMRVSAKLKQSGYYGSLQWDGDDYRYSYLKDIPFHVNAEKGDTIVTSGFSSIFPEGEIIGFVESVDKETANFLNIKVKLAVDFKKISDIYVVTNKKKEEKLNLEALSNE